MKFLTILLAFIFISSSFSQTDTDNDVLIKQLENLDQIKSGSEFSNQASIQQNGSFNDARIYQINTALFSSNSAVINQNGSGNNSSNEQTRSENSY